MHRPVTTKEQADKLAQYLVGLPLPYTVTVKEGQVIRGIPPNSLFHMWMQEIADWYGDRTMLDVKRDCHRAIGLPIRMKDPMFAYLWNAATAKLNDEQKDKVLIGGPFHISSGMTDKQFREYLNEIEQQYRPMGVPLTIPEERQ